MAALKKQSLSGDEITVDISVTLGTADLRVQQLLKLGRGAVVELDRNVNDYVDIYANNILIGHGEVVITENETIGISVTDIVKNQKINSCLYAKDVKSFSNLCCSRGSYWLPSAR